MALNEFTNILIKRRPNLESCLSQIVDAYKILLDTAQSGGTLFTCGNGGSNSDSYHIVGELLKSFNKKRPLNPDFSRKLGSIDPNESVKLKQLEGGIKAMALGSQTAFSTAFSNDVDPDLIFGQELATLGQQRDLLLCLSTSGNSSNVKYAALVARALGMRSILLTGKNNGDISNYVDVVVNVPETETYLIQELHISVYHCWCLALEDDLFKG
ncbi:D-sedoheptulose-7-phosphate isomerase [Levilactobacillus huananensis]|uniref:D-sedoheptulose-7-phosphate isomerase n=1 Tax=Levilactobacillus huananensis TaxID=2486019 RepID=UPI000F781769|nr:SIS domain-containing protein [Levilactobacillus huananensis]